MGVKSAIRIHSKDNVATLTDNAELGEGISIVDEYGRAVDSLTIVKHRIPRFHKITLTTIREGESIFKYGEKIGAATELIERGDWVHIHNIDSTLLSEEAMR